MTVHPIGHGKSTTNNMGSVKHPQYQTSPLMPGLYDFSVTAVNDHAAGEPSQPLRIYVPDLEEERAEREREYAKKEESRRAALRDEWDREIASIEAELSTGSKSMTKLDELIGQIRGIIAIMKRNSANRTFMDRAEAVHTKLSRAKYAKMELATWRTMLQKGVRDILSGAGRPDDAGSDFAQDVLEWPSANELAPAVRNLIYQTIVNLAESVPLLQIVMDQEVQNLLTPSEIAALGASDFERSDVEGDTAEMVYAPKWREIQPYDRTIEVLRACHLRPELFGTWLGKISGMHAKMERERKRRESEWKTKVSKEKRAAEKAAELASLEVAARMGSWTPEHSSETVGEDAARNDTSISEFTRVSESSDTTESEGVASASGSANGEAFATTSFSPPFPVVDVAEIPVEEHDFAELESADREVKVAPLRQQNSTAEASVSAQHVVAPQDTTSALLPDSTVASEQVSQLSDVLSPERRAIERPSIAQQANRIEEPAARHETPSRRQEPLSKPESDSGSLPVEEDRYASGNVPTAQSPKSAKGAPKASPHSSQQRSGIWKASKKCTRVNPDGSCVHAVRCWFSSMHTWQPAQPVQPGSSAAPALPTAPPTPLARTDGDSVLNGLNIIITKNPVVPIAAPAPSEVDKAAEKTASFVADETESVKVAKKVSPIESQEIAALWDMPSPTIPNLSRRNDDAGSRTTEEKNVEARRPLAAPPGLKHPLDKPSAPQQKQPASQSPQRISKPAVPPEAQAKRASEFAPRRSAPPPAPSSGETKLSDFLRTVGLARFVQLFEEHEFDMESLMLASDEDFRALKLPLGPMLKLKEGIKKLRESMKSLPEDSTNGMSDAGGYGDSEEASEEEPGEAVEGQQHFFGSQQQIAHGQAVSQQPDLSRQVYMTAADGSAYIVQQAYQPFTTMAQMHIARQPIKVPGHFVCPITRTIMSHPVVAPDGYTYQEDAIRNWLKQNGTSPMTQVPLTHDKDGRKTKIVLTPNYALRALILEFQATYPEHLYQYETM
ncbi:hypothetical protein DFJ74DRAFT_32571 [Hyaloraphidium curvatum]|nr:hypothetical protein DFJ74DRAFT_32571 [Hyaloraphidium curvatum]